MKSEAKEMCNSCPISTKCLEWAIANDEAGIWAGTTRGERRKLTRASVALVA